MSESSRPKLVRIAMIGGESTGKSSLAEALAAHYQASMAGEFARHYLTPKNGHYTIDESPVIAEGQIAWEQEAAATAERLLICDTDPVATLLWSEYYFNGVHPRVRELADEHQYDLYILTSADFPWEHDGLRKSPDSREWFDRRIQEVLEQMKRPYIRVSGPPDQRLADAIRVIDPLLE